MKVLILAGGFGTRLSEETHLIPKPMVEIGGRPILWHIMKIYSSYGFNDFIILLGYKGYVIKEYFANYFLHQNDVTIDIANNKIETHSKSNEEPWKVTLVNTGLDTMTGGRLKRAQPYLNQDEPFMFTYGDGVSNIDIKALVDFHKKHDKLITMTSVQPEGRFGAMRIGEDMTVSSFEEKPEGEGGWINGGFFVCEPKVLDYIKGDETMFEREPLNMLVRDRQLVAYKHKGFWQCMDTLRDKRMLENMWETEKPRWKIW
ncbi:glucose-1-phosphate cytidylyltransferase [Catalinimonas sp. 4WD22]|uniref:glucose-1-phosphate cytidylyltransferase n=1 Tax=Catalinimonas locisalis TaxID=3133978 RepID=UPI003101A191